MMKYFIYAIAAIHLGCSTSLGEETGFDRQLPAPDSIHIRGKIGEKSKKLKELLKSGNFKQFYGYSNTVLSELNAMRRHGTMTREEACDMLWSLYLISGAPMYEAPDYTSDQPWPYKNEKNNDIYSKARISTAISLMDINQISTTLKISKRKLIHFNISLLSGIIKKIKKMHIKDFHKNEESLYHEIFSPIKHQSEMDASAKDIGNDIKDYEWTHKWNNLVTFSSRNQMLDTYVIRIMEKRFIPMLVKYFPDQAGEVVKYIRKAGYGDGEVLDLIDRTAGYNSKTAYLYQGKSGEEHKKKLQRKQSGE